MKINPPTERNVLTKQIQSVTNYVLTLKSMSVVCTHTFEGIYRICAYRTVVECMCNFVYVCIESDTVVRLYQSRFSQNPLTLYCTKCAQYRYKNQTYSPLRSIGFFSLNLT